jgi:hypothetical protein
VPGLLALNSERVSLMIVANALSSPGCMVLIKGSCMVKEINDHSNLRKLLKN